MIDNEIVLRVRFKIKSLLISVYLSSQVGYLTFVDIIESSDIFKCPCQI